MSSPLDCCRATCAAFTSDRVSIDIDAVTALAKLLPSNDDLIVAYAGACETNRFPELTFASDEDEAGFLTLVHALDFGSGFRPHLHRVRNGQGAWLTIRAGMVQLGLQSTKCDPAFLKSISVDAVDRLFDLRGDAELRRLAEFIAASLTEIGCGLERAGAASLGEFVSRFNTAADFVDGLVTHFPDTFRDEYVVGGQRVCLYKKAQLVVSEIHLRFNNRYPDQRQLTAFVDNVVVAVLRYHNVLRCAPELTAKLDSEQPVLMGSEDEVALRAQALHAVELIVELLDQSLAGRNNNINSTPSSAAVCNYFWGVLGKTKALRPYPRHLTPDTKFY